MRIILDIATVLGGIAALLFFWDRFSTAEIRRKQKETNATRQLHTYSPLAKPYSSPSPRAFVIAVSLGVFGVIAGALTGGIQGLLFARMLIDISGDLGITIPIPMIAIIIGAIGGVSVPMIADDVLDSLPGNFESIDVACSEIVLGGTLGAIASAICTVMTKSTSDSYDRLLPGAVLVWAVLGGIYLFRGGLHPQ